jgi:hypothetical protein
MTSTSLDAVPALDGDCGCSDTVSAFGTVRLDSVQAVNSVLDARAHWRVFLPRMHIALSGKTEESVRLQKRVDTLADACGCDLGAAMALIVTGVWLAYSLTIGPSYGLWGTSWRAVVVMFVAATIGKLAGIARARIQLRQVLLEVRAMM